MAYFSLITPMYNRASTIGRTLESCLAQSFPDFELLVVDDASDDQSVAIVSSYRDPRLRLLRHDHNRGPCPARNTGLARAQGTWCVMVDSDFALLPHALERLHARTRAAASEIGNVASSCAWEHGRHTPFPSPGDLVLDYAGYLRWAERVQVSEKLECIRRSVFAHIAYPDTRAWELEFHLALAARWKVAFSNEVLVRVFSDAPNRLTVGAGSAAVRRVIQDAPDKLESFERVLETHGEALRRWAPELHDYVAGLAAAQACYLGLRRRALRHVAGVLRRRPLSRFAWAAGALVLAGPRLAAWLTVQRRRVRG